MSELNISGAKALDLCYGENRRQDEAALYIRPEKVDDPLALHKFELIEGKAPSYINMTDLHRLIETATRLGAGWKLNFGKVPLMAIGVKHGNACGVAVGDDPYEVIKKMVEGDSKAISGGLVLVNFELDAESASLLCRHAMPDGHKRILDSVIAPKFADGAIEELVRKKTQKCRLFVNPNLIGGLGLSSIDISQRFRPVRGGFLVQNGDHFVLDLNDPEVEGTEPLSLEQRENIILAWAIGSTSNSNTIILTKDRMLIGSGIGQRSRVFACQVAILYAEEAGHDTDGAIAYSDSFFPFPDGPEVLADVGISVIFTSKGSIRFKEVKATCDERGIVFVTIPDAIGRGFYGH